MFHLILPYPQDCQMDSTLTLLSSLSSASLYIACKQGDLEAVKTILMDPGIDPNQAKINGATPLYVACKKGHVDVVKTLLMDSRVDPNQAISNTIQTPLFIATLNGYNDIVKALLENARINLGGKSLLHIAARRGVSEHLDVIKTLLADHRVDPNQSGKSHKRETPLYIATKNNRLEAVKLLLADSRVDIDQCETANGVTLLKTACKNGVEFVAELLKTNRITVSKKDKLDKSDNLIIRCAQEMNEKEKMQVQMTCDQRYIMFLKEKISELYYSPYPGQGYQLSELRFHGIETDHPDVDFQKFITQDLS